MRWAWSRVLATASCAVVLACQQPSSGETVAPVGGDTPPRAPSIDQEPNDSPDEAGDLALGGSGQLGPSDIDYYRVHRSPEVWSLRGLASDPSAVRVDVLRRGQPLPDELAPQANVYAGRRNGDVLVVVRPLGSETVDYVLQVEAVDTGDFGTLLAEPNGPGDPVEAGPGVGRYTGFIDAPVDRDQLQLSEDMGSLPALAVEVSGVAGLQLGMAIRHPETGVRLQDVVGVGQGDGVGIPNVGLLEDGRAPLIEVFAVDGGHSESPYHLLVHATPLPGEALELEPNDAGRNARPLALGSTLTGTFHREGDVDTYSFREPVCVLVEPDSRSDIAIDDYDFSGVGEWEMFLMRPSEGDTETIDVSLRETSTRGLPTYRLTSARVPAPFDWDVNDGSASPIDAEVFGYLYAGDTDVFSYRVRFAPIDGASRYTFRLQPPDGIDLGLAVADGSGILGESTGAAPGHIEELALELGRGEYFITVTGDEAFTCLTPYRLWVE